MTIRYALIKNEVMVGKDRLMAQVYSSGTLDEEEVIRRSSLGGNTASLASTMAALATHKRSIEEALLDGFNVSTAMGTFSVRIKGVFEGYDDHFDPRRHEVVVRFRPSQRLIKNLQHRVRTHKIEPHELRPHLVAFMDVVSGERDRIMTPGGIGHIYGNRLKFDPQDPEQGLYILGENRRVLRVRVVAENQPRKIMFLIPSLPAGAYRLAVRAVVHGGESVETGFLDDALTVTADGPLLDAGDDCVPARPFLLDGPRDDA